MKLWIQKLKARLPAIFLFVATILFWGTYDRYEVVGAPLLRNPELADAWRVRGDCVGTNGTFVLTTPRDGKRAGLNFRLPNAMDHTLIRVRGRMRGEGVVEGKYTWRCARLVLIQYDQNNKWVPGPHGLIAESGTFDWMVDEDVFEIIPDAVNADLVIENLGDEGIAWFDQLAAEVVRIRPSYYVWQIGFVAAWVALGALYYRRCRLDHRRLRILILLNVFAIFAGALMPGEWVAKPAQQLKDWFEQRVRAEQPITSPSSNAGKPVIRTEAQKQKSLVQSNQRRIDRFNETVGGAHKAGHFVLFASLCFLVYCSAALEGQGPAYYLKVAGDLLLFAAITEALQHLTLDRAPGVRDFLTDVYGMLAAFVVFLALRGAWALRRG